MDVNLWAKPAFLNDQAACISAGRTAVLFLGGMFAILLATSPNNAAPSTPEANLPSDEEMAMVRNTDEVELFLSDNCYDCHDDTVQKGGLNLLDLALDLSDPANFETWKMVHFRVSEGEMPPKNKKRPDNGELKEFLARIDKPILQVDREIAQMLGRVQTRRLTRREYEYTVHDLLGVDIPLIDLLPKDPAFHGFETVAKVQQLSHFNMAAYLKAADHALDGAFERIREGDQKFSKHHAPAELGRRGGGNYRGPDIRDGKSIAWPMRVQYFGRMPATTVPEDGWYRVTLKNVEAINPINGVVWGTLRSGQCASNAPMMYDVGIVEATKKKRDLVFEAWIHEGHMLELKPNDVTLKNPPSGAQGGNVSFKGRNLAKEGYSGIAVTGIQIERIYPNANHEQLKSNLLAGVDWKALKEGRSYQAIAPAIRHFASRAYRRPVSQEQVADWVEIALAEKKKPGSHLHDALKAAYRGILCSPRFLTFIEPSGKLDDNALANRLSYMVWNSMPDAKLRRHADAGQLTSDPTVLHDELSRLLNHPRSERFITSLTDQWLSLNDIDFTAPDRRLYRTYDLIVRDGMLEETRSFVRHLIMNNQNVSKLIDADYSFLNERMARFYGMKDVSLVPGQGIQKIKVPDNYTAGLVTQASLMKVTANGTTTSPVLRGIWVNERILGMFIPPPPPAVPAVEPDIRGAISIRDQVEKHSSSESCAGCHTKIDPTGFAFESFDPVGLFRVAYGNGGKGTAKVDPSGVTPEGDAFKNIWGWKSIYAPQRDLLTKAFAKNLITYATGAPPRFSDRYDMKRIVEKAREKNYGMRSIVHAVVASNAFQTK
ncbi:MAG: DUF1592 domain-containing protein [Verrucomicrobiota bacterium]